MRIEGVEHVPREGPAILVPNHQSIIDPMFVQGFCPRFVHSMTKSTQFAHGFFRRLIPRLLGFPVRRYRIDPQAVRMSLRLLEAGEVVCIYPEGERTWDGTLQPFRKGTIRVLLRAGVPVIPVGLDGTYDVWPRWRRGPRTGVTVRVRYGAPIRFGEHRDREAREAALLEAERRLRERLLELSGQAAREEAMEGADEEAGERARRR